MNTTLNHLFIIFIFSGCTFGQTQSKKNFLKRHPQANVQGKSTGHFKASIEITNETNNSIEFTANIVPLRNFTSADVFWKLPEEAKILNGEMRHSIRFEDSSFQSKIIIDKASIQYGNQIFFFITKNENGKTVGFSHSFLYQNQSKIKENSGLQLQKQKKAKSIRYYE